MSVDDLKSIGVTQLGQWKKIIRERDAIKSKSSIAAGSDDFIPDEHLKLVNRIGGGNFGQVWRAKWNETTGKRYGLKTFLRLKVF